MLQYEVLKHELNEKQAALDELKDALGLERLREEVEMLENKAAEPGFYDNMESAQKILQKTAALKQKDETYLNLVSRCEDTLTLIEMGNEEEDLSLLPEAQEEVEAIGKEIETMRLTTLLTGEYDSKNAILRPCGFPAARRHRTGPRCCSVCTTVGVSVTALRFLRSITLRATKRA